MSVEIGDYGGHPLRRWKRFLLHSNWLHQAIILTVSYAAWVLAVHFLSLSFVTYFLGSPGSGLQDIHDFWYSNQVSLMGLSAVAFVILIWRLHPITSISWQTIFEKRRFEKFFIPAFLKGTLITGLFILAFLIEGAYRYLGLFIQFGAAPLELANLILRMAALTGLVYSEEFLFRFKLVSYLKGHLPTWLWMQLIALAYCGIKALQFDLSLMHLVTLYLLSLALSLRAQADKNFERGAGYWAACLIVIQPLASLPILGNEFSGALMVKPTHALHFISGGLEGPISSWTLQLLLILDLLRSMLRKSSLIGELQTRTQSKSLSKTMKL